MAIRHIKPHVKSALQWSAILFSGHDDIILPQAGVHFVCIGQHIQRFS
jgi:hypothetical protein